MRSELRRKHRDSAVWQRRFWEQTIDEPGELEAFLDYIHYNPVKHGYATCPHAWPASSNTFRGHCPPYDGPLRVLQYRRDRACNPRVFYAQPPAARRLTFFNRVPKSTHAFWQASTLLAILEKRGFRRTSLG